MSLVLDLPVELESELADEAARNGLPALQLLAIGRNSRPSLHNGAELLAYWQSEGLVGTRPDVVDSSAHARSLPDQSQSRARP